jgi:hypothetical protein
MSALFPSLHRMFVVEVTRKFCVMFQRLDASSSLLFPKISSHREGYSRAPAIGIYIRDLDIRVTIRLDVVLMALSVDVAALFTAADG